ncbi:UDP-Glycosyltransferase superfamily protein [Perilla frutescens var. frutescens]|nr:UDP-Glycosyltransferase superfamily protein [Perilla frutescens var. frutescens]
MESSPHIVILPTPGMGHLIPLGEFAKKLHRLHGVTSTFILPTDGPLSKAQSSFFSSLPPAVDHLLLPPVSFDDLPPDVKIETRISLTITRSLPAIRRGLASLHESKKIAAFVVDLFGTDGFDAARELHIPCYIFYPSTAMALCMFFYLPELDKTVSSEYRDLPEKVQIPGCIPIHGRDLFDPAQDRKNEAYKWVIHHMKRYRLADGIVLNSFKELEPGPIEYLLQKEEGKPRVFPIGPIIKMGSESSDEDVSCPCSKWLDEQPSGSVLYVSFGSGGTLSHAQIIELALGLELSGQRFLWVLRLPNNAVSNATYFNISNSGDPLAYLPEGFLERTKGQGLVVPFWGPQSQILAHTCTGAFLTHCGWNSVLESVTNGVPMIAWPLYAEQRMNAVMIHEDVRVALRVHPDDNGLVHRVQITNVVKGLMEGQEGKGIRTRMRDLKDAAAKTLAQNGASTKFLAELASKWNTTTTSI